MHLKKKDFPLALKFALDNMKDEKNVVISGFRGSGLYPFDLRAVNYDILKKSKKSKQNVDQQNSKNFNFENTVKEKQQFLQTFEKSLSVDLISKFKEASINGPVIWKKKHCLITGFKFTKKLLIFSIQNNLIFIHNH